LIFPGLPVRRVAIDVNAPGTQASFEVAGPHIPRSQAKPGPTPPFLPWNPPSSFDAEAQGLRFTPPLL